MNRQTDKTENVTLPQLRWRAVKLLFNWFMPKKEIGIASVEYTMQN